MLSAAHAVQYFEPLKLVVTIYFDIEHGTNRNIWLSLAEVGLKGLMHLGMMAVNLPSMPDDTDMRFAQIRDLVREHFNLMTPATSPIFSYLAPDMHKERQNDLMVDEGESHDQALWRHLKAENEHRTKDGHACVARFCSVIAGTRSLVRTWHCRAFQLAVASIEANMVTTKSLPNIAFRAHGADEASVGEEGTTSKNVVSTVDRSIRSAGANGVVISLALLSDEVNKRHFAAVVHVGELAMHWSGQASRTMKSIGENQGWFLSQLGGEFVAHIFAIFRALQGQQYLTDAAFLPPVAATGIDLLPEIAFEDEVAGIAGDFALALGRHQLKRFIWFFGYPHALQVLSGGSEDSQQAALRQFRDDAARFDRLREARNRSETMALHVERSLFQKLGVQQFLEACKEFDFGIHADLQQLAVDRFSTIMSSSIVEHLNNWQKNSRNVSAWGGRYRRPQTSLASSIRGNVVSNLHRYKPLPKDLPSAYSVAPLRNEDIAPTGECSMEFNQVVGKSQKAPYWSPGVSNIHAPIADLHAARQLGANYGKMDGLWKGAFAKPTRKVCFRNVSGGGAKQWLLALDHFADSCVLAWPVSLKKFRGQNGNEIEWLVDFEEATEPIFEAVCDFKDYEAFVFTWRSWSWQLHFVKDCSEHLEPGLRPFRSSGADEMLKVFATHAFFDMERSLVARIGEDRGIEGKKFPTLFELLMQAVMSVLGCDQERACTILQQRFANMLWKSAWSQEMLAVDEAAKTLDENDREEFWRCREAAQADEVEFKQFEQQWKQARRTASKSTPGAVAKKVKAAYKGPKTFELSYDHIEQKHIKPFFPPQTYVWRARHDTAWQCRFQDLPIRSCKDTAWGGETGAIRELLRHSWHQYLTSEGLDDSACPVKLLFT